jgi:phosphoserine phosphatase RsbU/P
MKKKIWDQISNIGVKGDENGDEKRHIHLVNQVILFACVFTPSFIPFLWACGDTFYVPIQTGFSLLFPFAFLFSRARKFTLGIIYVQFLVDVNLIIASTLNYNIGSEYLLFPLSLIPFIVFRKIRTSVIAFSFSVLSFFIIQILKNYVEPAAVLEENSRLVLFESVVFMSFLICAVIILNFRVVMMNYESSLQHQKKLLQEKQNEIVDSIKYAKRIQKASMPNEKYIDKKLKAYKSAQAEK